MKPVWWILVLWLGCCMLPVAGRSQEDPVQQRQAYVEAASAVLAAYMKEQSAWNHYFTTIAPDQSASDQIKPQETYRRFLEDTLSQWRQIKVVPACQSPHLLYELALSFYDVAADFRLAFLYARSALLGSKKAADLVEERSRTYTTLGDEYFKKAALSAQASGCVVPAASR